MCKITVEFDDALAGWIERRRDAMTPEEFVARSVAAYRAIDERGTSVKAAHMHDEMSQRLDELQRRIARLNRSLKERWSVQPPEIPR